MVRWGEVHAIGMRPLCHLHDVRDGWLALALRQQYRQEAREENPIKRPRAPNGGNGGTQPVDLSEIEQVGTNQGPQAA